MCRIFSFNCSFDLTLSLMPKSILFKNSVEKWGAGVDLSGKENLILATVDLDNSICLNHVVVRSNQNKKTYFIKNKIK